LITGSGIYTSDGTINEPVTLLISVRDPGCFVFLSWGFGILSGAIFLVDSSFSSHPRSQVMALVLLFSLWNTLFAIALVFSHGPTSLVLPTSWYIKLFSSGVLILTGQTKCTWFVCPAINPHFFLLLFSLILFSGSMSL